MKPAISLLLSIIIFGASFGDGLFMLDYKINRDFYEIYCVNKAKPEMDCHGKCQMKKNGEKTANFFSLVKYSFEFNILPAKVAYFSIAKEPRFVTIISIFSYHDGFLPEIILGILPHPPQI
ncbi:hypothetical protein [Kaistella solincola]|uniref:hypothetical protein n=1 Tax=Kaistella solincola TaxID=510955 RepID=UPI000689F0FA|nr:hypothetical protein [Kaistella solincola]